MDDARLLARLRSTLAAWIRAFPPDSPGGRAITGDGLAAAVVPALPERSIVNCVAYRDAAILEAALPGLAGVYGEAGVRAWTVWVPESDAPAASVLADAGHVLDAAPRAMAMPLGDLVGAPAPPGLDRAPSGDAIAAVIDESYGFPAGLWPTVFPQPPKGLRHYAAAHEGRAACVLSTLEHEGDCGVFFVGTLPCARGRGLATGLLGVALEDARRRGATTTSLQATRMGAPLYARLGYRDLGAIQMWERRVPRL
jgi:GNAT superfamily N-acetyltransferase